MLFFNFLNNFFEKKVYTSIIIIGGDGSCACNLGWTNSDTGELCNSCASGYYGESCEKCSCPPNSHCNDGSSNFFPFFFFFFFFSFSFSFRNTSFLLFKKINLVIGGDGTCPCNTGWTNSGKTDCNTCDTGYYGVNCKACPVCGSHGTCNEGKEGDGNCTCSLGWMSSYPENCNVCAPGWTGTSCNSCLPGYYGSSCTPCSCPTNSHCNDGVEGDTGNFSKYFFLKVASSK